MFHWIGQNLYVTNLINDCIWVLKNDEHYAIQLKIATVNHMVGILYFINYEHEVIENPNESIVTIVSAYMNASVTEHESVSQCYCIHGKCVYHIDEYDDYQLSHCE
ncbi:unnamed protein product [Rotaria sp. Silwood1]|nr:unnamed protein product [Rotaria sp. Silwood1]CAF1629683.1 unnamed protein product [Rotaria sp. Silwood1]CAF3804434.1 unnamed protein product [Rotaria sp. Silwood1]CAF3972726.1 unnamed protein product [Rotaria sp. Silwood1]CAF4901056.1 unnamed protein product [Rotaria sp. Silwood1]